jgi:hypothetical protein
MSPARTIPAVGAAAVAALAGLTIAVWPASEADKARADGERYGEAVAALYAAESPGEVDAALADMHAAAADARGHAGEAVGDHVGDQEDALARAADGYAGMATTDGFEADLYEAELDAAVDDLADQADEFRTNAPDVQAAFWDGYDDGVVGS